VHRNAHIRLLQGRRIVHAITSHAHHVVAVLQGRQSWQYTHMQGSYQ
jgi:hypothetical protein